MERILRKVELPEELFLLLESSRSCVRSISKRAARIHRVQSTSPKKAAVLAGSVLVYIQKEPTATQKIRGYGKTGEGSIVMERNVKKLGCLSQDTGSLSKCSAQSIQKKERTSSRSGWRLRYTPVAESSIIIRENRGPSLGVLQPSHPHERSFFAPKFEDRSQEKTLKQERWARREVWGLTKQVSAQSPRKPGSNQGHVFSRSLDWCLPAQSNQRKENYGSGFRCT